MCQSKAHAHAHANVRVRVRVRVEQSLHELYRNHRRTFSIVPLPIYSLLRRDCLSSTTLLRRGRLFAWFTRLRAR